MEKSCKHGVYGTLLFAWMRLGRLLADSGIKQNIVIAILDKYTNLIYVTCIRLIYLRGEDVGNRKED